MLANKKITTVMDPQLAEIILRQTNLTNLHNAHIHTYIQKLSKMYNSKWVILKVKFSDLKSFKDK